MQVFDAGLGESRKKIRVIRCSSTETLRSCGDSGKSEILRVGLESTTDLPITISDGPLLSDWIFVGVTPLN